MEMSESVINVPTIEIHFVSAPCATLEQFTA